MPDRPASEPVESVESVKDGYSETQPASADDVAKAREHEELLGSSPSSPSDRSGTGETRPRPNEDPEQSDGAIGDR